MDDIEGDAAATIAPREEITLKEVVPESMQGELENMYIVCNHTQCQIFMLKHCLGKIFRKYLYVHVYTYICPLQTFMGQRLQYRRAMKHNVFMMDHALATTFIAHLTHKFLFMKESLVG